MPAPGTYETGLVSDRAYTFRGSGGTGDQAEFLDMLAALPAEGGRIFVDGVVGLGSTLNVSKPLAIEGLTPDSGFRLYNDAAVEIGDYFDFGAVDFSAWTTCAAVAAPQTVVDVPSAWAATVADGDLFLLASTDAITGIIPHQGGAQYPMELHRILARSAGAAGRILLEIDRPTYDAFTTAPRVRAVPAKVGGHWHNLSFYADAATRGANQTALVVRRGDRVALEGLTFSKGASALVVSLGYDCTIDRCGLPGIYDTTAAGLQYGLSLGPSAGVKIRDCALTWARHALSTFGIGSGAGGTGPRYGGPLDLTIANCTLRDRSTAALDTHPEGAAIRFHYCTLTGHYPAQLRARDTLLESCDLAADQYGVGATVKASGARFVNCRFRGGFIGIHDASEAGAAGTLEVVGCSFDQVGSVAIYAGGAQTLHCCRNRFSGSANYTTPVGSPFLNRAAIAVTNDKPHRIIGNDLRKTTGLYAAELQGAAIAAAAGLRIFGNDLRGYGEAVTGIVTATPGPTTITPLAGSAGVAARDLNWIDGVGGSVRAPRSLLQVQHNGAAVGPIDTLDLAGSPVDVDLDGLTATVTVEGGGGIPGGGALLTGANRLAVGADWLSRRLVASASGTVGYQRGAESISVSATVGTTTATSADQAGTTVETHCRDYLIRAEELVFGGLATEPLRGDRIIEEVDGTNYVYEVLPLGREKCWRWLDPQRNTYRIHTKLILQEADE